MLLLEFSVDLIFLNLVESFQQKNDSFMLLIFLYRQLTLFLYEVNTNINTSALG